MPDKSGGKVISGLLSRPESRGPVTLKEVAWKDEDPLTRFMGGLTGLDEPGGGQAGMLGATAGMLSPLDDLIRTLRSTGGVKGALQGILKPVTKGIGTEAGFGTRSVMQPGVMNEFMPVGPEAVSKFHVGTPTPVASPAGRKAIGNNKIAGIPEYDGPGYVKSSLPQLEDALDATGRLKPDVAAESARLMSEMIQNPTEKAAFQQFIKLNPTAAGHTKEFKSEAMQPTSFMDRLFGHKGSGTAQTTAIGPVKGFPEAQFQTEIHLNPKGVLYKRDPANVTGHELEHGAQIFKEGKNWWPRYQQAQDALGYKNNPYEVAANRMGQTISKLVNGK